MTDGNLAEFLEKITESKSYPRNTPNLALLAIWKQPDPFTRNIAEIALIAHTHRRAEGIKIVEDFTITTNMPEQLVLRCIKLFYQEQGYKVKSNITGMTAVKYPNAINPDAKFLNIWQNNSTYYVTVNSPGEPLLATSFPN